MLTFAFDVYGTLVDTAGVARALSAWVDDANAFALRWREKHLEYAFRRGLMRRYRPFDGCARDALVAVCAERAPHIPAAARDELMHAFAALPLFADAARVLPKLANANNCRLFAFSNGPREAVRQLLTANNALEFFTEVVSVEDTALFKPAPEVYAHFLHCAKASAKEVWLVSSNPFDIAGARAVGWRAAWLRRGSGDWEPWPEKEFAPTAIISCLDELAAAVE